MGSKKTQLSTTSLSPRIENHSSLHSLDVEVCIQLLYNLIQEQQKAWYGKLTEVIFMQVRFTWIS